MFRMWLRNVLQAIKIPYLFDWKKCALQQSTCINNYWGQTTNWGQTTKYAATHILMRQLYFITALLALCSCIQLASLVFMARSTTYESAGVSVATFMCDVDECTFKGNCSKSLRRHKLTHSAALLHCDFMGAALLHCDFMGCSFETKDSSSLKRHKFIKPQATRIESHYESNSRTNS